MYGVLVRSSLPYAVLDRPDGRPTATRRGRLNGQHDIRYHVGVYLPHPAFPPGAEMTSLRDGCTSLYLTLSRRGCKCNVATRGCDEAGEENGEQDGEET